MSDDTTYEGVLRYDQMVEQALRQVVRQSLQYAASKGLPGDHHFYITFSTEHPGVEIPPHLRAQYPTEMTIVLQYQFWDLDVGDEGFSVKLSFADKPERLAVPFSALTAFADPSVRFGLQFESGGERSFAGEDGGTQLKLPDLPQTAAGAGVPVTGDPEDTMPEDLGDDDEKVVTLDRFRKK